MMISFLTNGDNEIIDDLDVYKKYKKVEGKFVGQAAYEQIMRERNMAMSYLEEAGVSLGEDAKVVRLDKVVEIIDNTKQAFIEDGIEGEAVAVEHAIDRIKELRSEVLALKGGEQG